MRTVIETSEDVRLLQGKFVLCVDSNTPNRTLMDMSWGFAKEKRLMIVSGHGFVDLYGNRWDAKSEEDFINRFNKYLFPHMIEKGETDGGRFHRLLTNSELDYLFTKIKQENYL